jgi:hypothetical protein
MGFINKEGRWDSVSIDRRQYMITMIAANPFEYRDLINTIQSETLLITEI